MLSGRKCLATTNWSRDAVLGFVLSTAYPDTSTKDRCHVG
jgi:hypothetical protein